MTIIDPHRPVAPRLGRHRPRSGTAEAFTILRAGFTVAPILFGIDKFVGALTDWERYLAPDLADALPGSATQLMYAVGVVEIIAGVIVVLRPRIGGYVVAAWLAGIIANLVILGDHYDIALRDFGLLLAALALARAATGTGPAGTEA